MIKKLITACLIAVSLSVFAAAPSIVGRWSVQTPKGQMMQLIFNKDNTWEFDRNGDLIKDIWGKFTVKGDKLTVTATGGLTVCPMNQPGTYTIQLNGPQLTFIQVSDSCTSRAADFSLFWTQQ